MIAQVGVFRYVNNPHFGPFTNQELASMGNQIQIYESTWHDCLEEFKQSSHPTKIAILHYCEHDHKNFTRLADELKFHCSSVFILDDECHESQIKLLKTYFYEPYKLYVNAKLNFTAPNYYNDCQTWFESTAEFYRQNRHLLQQINSTRSKRINFDILLGADKQHRRYVYDNVLKDFNPKAYIMTFMGDLRETNSLLKSGWKTGVSGVELNESLDYSTSYVDYCGTKRLLSQIIPIDIYNQTNYSVIAETNISNDYSFYTEKTAKPILGKRLFIMFAGRYYLHNLRSLGFKTFRSVIDESYDKIEDKFSRWSAGLESMKYLNQQNSAEILIKIQPIVEHNYNLMMDTDWWQDLRRDIRKSYNLGIV